MSIRQTCIVVMLAVTTVGVHASEAKLELPALRAIVTDPLHSVAPGCAVGVFGDGTDLITAAGMADMAGKRPIDGDTLFYAASVSKQFTALAIAQLVVGGRLGLDDDVRKYIPQLPRYEAPVTIAMLLHHTSGIRDWIGLMQLAGRDAATRDGAQVALQLVLEQKSTNFRPGTRFLYSNGGYLLLAEVVARASGLPFHEYERKYVLDPMGMRDSYFLHGADPQSDTAAHGYVPKDGGFVVRDTYPRFGGSGGLMTSMNDLARYYRDISVGHKVWTPEVAKVMLAPGTFTNGVAVEYEPGGAMGYASGLTVGQRRGQFTVQHDGAADGFRNEFGWFPQARLGVGLLCNRGDWNPLDKFDAVVQQVRPGFLAGSTPEDLRGVYHSDELAADYIIVPEGDALRLTIVSTSGVPATTMLMHKATGADHGGGYAGSGMYLTPDANGRDIVVGTSRTRGIRLVRTPAN